MTVGREPGLTPGHFISTPPPPTPLVVYVCEKCMCARACHRSLTGSSYTQALWVSPRWHQQARHPHTHTRTHPHTHTSIN